MQVLDAEFATVAKELHSAREFRSIAAITISEVHVAVDVPHGGSALLKAKSASPVTRYLVDGAGTTISQVSVPWYTTDGMSRTADPTTGWLCLTIPYTTVRASSRKNIYCAPMVVMTRYDISVGKRAQ